MPCAVRAATRSEGVPRSAKVVDTGEYFDSFWLWSLVATGFQVSQGRSSDPRDPDPDNRCCGIVKRETTQPVAGLDDDATANDIENRNHTITCALPYVRIDTWLRHLREHQLAYAHSMFEDVSVHFAIDAPQHMNRHRISDRKSTRLNSSHSQISYAVFCLKKKSLTS